MSTLVRGASHQPAGPPSAVGHFLRATLDITADQIVGSAVGLTQPRDPRLRTAESAREVMIIVRATRLLTAPDWVSRAARILTDADTVALVSAIEGSPGSDHVLRLQWTSTQHIVLQRHCCAFGTVDRACASELMRLCAHAAAASGDTSAMGWRVTLRDLPPVWVRLARPSDAEAVAALHRRCSDRTRYLRYLSLADRRKAQLRGLVGGQRGSALVATKGDQVVGLANLAPANDTDARSAELAVLVEDTYQRNGLGSALAHRLIDLAEKLGFTEVSAVALGDNSGVRHLVARSPLSWHSNIDAGVAYWRAELLH